MDSAKAAEMNNKSTCELNVTKTHLFHLDLNGKARLFI